MWIFFGYDTKGVFGEVSSKVIGSFKSKLNMKKIFIVSVFIISGYFCSAQITRAIWGLELGKSTKAEVRNVLNQKMFDESRLFIEKDANSSEEEWTLNKWNSTNANRTFAGDVWQSVSFVFYGDLLYRVNFHDFYSETGDKLPNTVEFSYNAIKGRIEKKYSRYKLSSSKERDCIYSDGRTKIRISLGYWEFGDGTWVIELSYIDKQILDKIMKIRDDEL
jgi:hypothetical protein